MKILEDRSDIQMFNKISIQIKKIIEKHFVYEKDYEDPDEYMTFVSELFGYFLKQEAEIMDIMSIKDWWRKYVKDGFERGYNY